MSLCTTEFRNIYVGMDYSQIYFWIYMHWKYSTNIQADE